MHHSFVVTNVDAAVMNKQAVARRDDYRHQEETIVHYHAHGKPCNNYCTAFHIGHESHPVNVECPTKEETNAEANA